MTSSLINGLIKWLQIMGHRYNVNSASTEDAFIGRVDFGRFGERSAVVQTYQDEVYVHLKDRSKGRVLTLRATDYLQFALVLCLSALTVHCTLRPQVRA